MHQNDTVSDDIIGSMLALLQVIIQHLYELVDMEATFSTTNRLSKLMQLGLTF